MSLLVFDQFELAVSIDRCEVDAKGRAVSLFRSSRRLELVLGTVSRQQKGERFARQWIGVGAAIAILLVFVAWRPTVYFANVPHDPRLAGDLAAVWLEVHFRFDEPGEALRRVAEIDRLHPGGLDDNHVLRPLVELGDPLADA